MNIKKRNRGIFSTFLCCFGNKNNNSSSNYQAPHVEENGNPRVNIVIISFCCSFSIFFFLFTFSVADKMG